ncbi:MAG: GNAT family N-acetyltransferase, partial [Hyphomonadaceae bacterium]
DASKTARPFFERQGWSVDEEQVVVRRDIPLANFKMSKPLTMWTRLAAQSDLPEIFALDAAASQDAHRRNVISTGAVAGMCWVGGRHAEIDGYIVAQRGGFFGRDFLALLWVAPAARRAGLASALMGEVERTCAGSQLFTSTNESNAPMQTLLRKHGYLAAGVVSQLDPGDPELVFVKRL